MIGYARISAFLARQRVTAAGKFAASSSMAPKGNGKKQTAQNALQQPKKKEDWACAVCYVQAINEEWVSKYRYIKGCDM